MTNQTIAIADGVADRLRALRKARGLSQEAVAEKINVSLRVYSESENKLRKINHAELIALCIALDVSADELLFGSTAWRAAGVAP